MFNWIKPVSSLFILLFALNSWAGGAAYHFGQPISEAQIKPWNIDIAPDGAGLPPGQASADDGEPIYLQRCAACHGEFGEGMGRFPVLTGSRDELIGDRTRKTVGGFWPYSTTLYDYINRAMPFGNAQSLTPDQIYGVIAYILSMNDIIDSDTVINAKTLPKIDMPNRDGFIPAQGSDLHIKACMQDCKTDVSIKSRANPQAVNSAGE